MTDRYLAVVPHGDGVRVDADDTLPAVAADDVAAAVTALRAVGVTAHPLRPSASDTVDGHVVMLLEFDTDPSPEARFVPTERVVGLSPPLRARLTAWAAERRTGIVPALRPRWARPGWFGPFADWVDASIRAVGATPGARRVVQQWAISSVWATDSTDGTFYAKAVFGSPATDGRPATGFWHEPALTRLLWTEHGSVVPEPVAIDADAGWMLMRDMAATPLDTSDVGPAPALSRLAAIQRHWTARLDDAIAVGCGDRRPSTVLDRAVALAAARRGVTDDLARSFAANLPVLRWMSDRLENGPVSLTLTHGDLHDGNVAVRDDGSVVLFDWSDGAVGHPFMDIDVFLHRRDRAEHDHLRKTYLNGWSDVADPATLDELAGIARIFSRLNQAITSCEIAEQIEPDDRAPFERGLAGAWQLFVEAWRTWRVRPD